MNATDRLLRRRDVEDLVGLGRSLIYSKMAKNEFPRPIKLGVRAVRWRESDVRRWIDGLGKGGGRK